MTPAQGVGMSLPEVNWRTLDLGARLAREWGAATVLISSKGEATLYPKQLTQFMHKLQKHEFPMIELQTNGIKLLEESYDKHLKEWYDLGLTTMAISMVHPDTKKNKEIYEPHNENVFDLVKLVDKLHKHKMSVRLSCIMLKGYIDDIDGVANLVDFAKKYGIEQLTARSVQVPSKSQDPEVFEYAEKHKVPQQVIDDIRDFLDQEGTRLRELVHGAIVYDYKEQNICLSNCLTIESDSNAIRQIIFFPDGHVRYDWAHPGAILF
jgi:molybdenum cofactor biosynthesis enzyme MoaA